MNIVTNLDLLAVGVLSASTGILALIIFLNARRSITSKTFLFFAGLTIAYSVSNYLYYYATSPVAALWLIRIAIFFAVWHAFSLFQLFYVFPAEHVIFPKWYSRALVALVSVTSIATLTPFVFQRIGSFSATGGIARIENGPGIALFGITVVALVLASLILLFRKTLHASGVEKKQFRLILVGTCITFTLILVFNFVLPALLNNARFVPLAPVFILPFTIFTFYAIVRHKLLNVKIISTEILTFVLAVVILIEVIVSDNLSILLFRVGLFMFFMAFGFLLIQSVHREVEQREQLEKLTKELEAANVKLDDLSRFKSQLLSLASHQIRSPLAAIKGFAQLVIDGSYGDVSAKAKEAVTKMKQSADGLIGLINTLLDLRKVEEGKMDYQMAKVDMVKLVSETVEGLRSLAMSKKLEFTLKASKGVLWVNADAQKLKQVIQNVIDNAIKYTPKGSVAVELYEADHAVMFAVRDTGLGFAPEMAPHLFEEFVRDERMKKQILGTGLGLYIARKIIEAHGGRIWAESKGLQKGSAFFVTIKKIS